MPVAYPVHVYAGFLGEDRCLTCGLPSSHENHFPRGVITADVVVNFGAILAVLEAMNTITGTANTAINTNPAPVIKVLARDLKTVTRQLVRLAQIVTGETDSIDVA